MSTIKVNTIQGVGSSSGSTIKVNNDSTFISDGGAVTNTNLVQGLLKSWIKPAANIASITDSFNVSSLDDDGTGDGGVNFSNAMSNADYVILGLTQDQNTSTFTRQCDITDGTQATGTFDFEVYAISSSNNRTNSDTQAYFAVAGDLA